MSDAPSNARRRFDLRGQVQGVGLRPYVYRLATAHGLVGYVANNRNGAVIEVEGAPLALAAFERDLLTRLPPLARVSRFVRADCAPVGETAFLIRASEDQDGTRPEVAPDAATCLDCLRELFDPHERRYRYPFINCTNCGPRYSIIRSVPYDRPQTTMSVFEMCPDCAREYHDPADRRFHAQPIACPVCGPQVRLEPPARARNAAGDAGPAVVAGSHGHDSIHAAARWLADGAILAVKGIGGFHLACRADREDTVCRLRGRKLRDGKPLAVMVSDLATARRLCRLSAADEQALSSPATPIVLAPQAAGHGLAPSTAPDCRDFGLLLPYAPLHHLLFAEGLGPLVMTSANLAGQPLTYRDEDARASLSDVADAFLLHNREIHRPIDDSVVFAFRGETIPIRRARGFAPRPMRVGTWESGNVGTDPHGSAPAAPAHGSEAAAPDRRSIQNPKSKIQNRILALGGELKSAVCLLHDREAILSEHLGDLAHPDAFRHFGRAIERLKQLCAFEPDAVACDLHPGYLPTAYAQRLGLPVVAVQHHHAHIASVMAECGQTGPLVGLACDGTGYGPDHAVWGCEILLCERATFERLGQLEYFPLVGGDAAALETWRPAAALLRAAIGPGWPDRLRATRAGHDAPPLPLTDEVLALFDQQASRGLNAPPTSSLGRVFDAVSFLLGLCDRNRHEAEAAMALEAAAARATGGVTPLAYEVRDTGEHLTLSLVPTILDLVQSKQRGEATPHLAARFHETIALLLADAADRVARSRGVSKVGLSGGCFANRILLSRLVELLEARGLTVYYNRAVPSGDGGLALGQAYVAAWTLLAGGAQTER